MAELGDYILETRKRYREVEAFYGLTVIVGHLRALPKHITNPIHRKGMPMLRMHWPVVTLLSSGVCRPRCHHRLLPHLPFKKCTFPMTP